MAEIQPDVLLLRQAITERRVPKAIEPVQEIFAPIIREAKAAKIQNIGSIEISYTAHHVEGAAAVVHGSIHHEGRQVDLASVHSEGQLTGIMRRRRWTSSRGTRNLLWDSPHLIEKMTLQLERAMPGQIATMTLILNTEGGVDRYTAKIGLFPNGMTVSTGNLAGHVKYIGTGPNTPLHLATE